MQQALEALEMVTVDAKTTPNAYEASRQAITALRAAIEQAQEPVAWMYHGIRHDDTPHERPSLIWKPEYMDVMSAEKGAKATPLYTAPRQWQGLTDEELWELWNSHTEQPFPEWFVDFKRAYKVIAEKLREKNNG